MIKELTYGGGSFIFNPFVPNAPFLYPLKTSENRKVFWCFHGVEKGTLETNGLMGFASNHLLKHSIQMTKCLKLSTWGKLNISIIVCCITSVLRGMLWNSFDTFLIFPYFWHWSHILGNFSTSPLILCQKKRNWVMVKVLLPLMGFDHLLK